VNRFPEELDDLIARTKLRTLGIELDAATDAQQAFLAAWAVS
jgi:S-adenosylhomocysteine hydrolase